MYLPSFGPHVPMFALCGNLRKISRGTKIVPMAPAMVLLFGVLYRFLEVPWRLAFQIDPASLSSGYPCDIPPLYGLAIHGDPELAIAKAKASQDHQQHGVSISSQILILIFSQYVAYL